MKKLLFLSALLLVSCQNLWFENPCGVELARRESKKAVAMYIWFGENPEKVIAFGLSSISSPLSEGLDAKLEEELSPYEQKLELLEISKPRETERDVYYCSAVFSYGQDKYVSTYTVKKVHSGSRENLHSVEIQEVHKVEN